MKQLDLFTGKDSRDNNPLLAGVNFQHPEELRAFLSRLNVVEVGLFYLGDKVQKRPISSNYRGLCPFHKEKTPSFYLKPNKNRFACYGCGTHGGPLALDDMLGGTVYKQIAYRIKIYDDFPSLFDFSFGYGLVNFNSLADKENHFSEIQEKFILILNSYLEREVFR